MYSGPLRISEGERFALDSYGNGAAYTFRDKTGKESVWMQDDDASAFRETYDALQTLLPSFGPDEILGILWNDHDYGAAASPDADA
ncbi:hypothetical protein D869_gp097 [Caulobacter phage CcrRogue]|uniref:Uncharacterized protein n=1 Tax=Caulobacter phage CcrRogue TaxID=2927986 RepID=K4K3J1_9CAUD|nr:hypothetical protein D869_gp004 [Caulobacter phage CcrRogue]YP_006989364.1 hypothetical protein D869_gp097 [Caulobacter phage CcrRogue]AFU86486.1 hypothetical protein CcrRogue_gp004 [Caulobacter phage CcrRogue]AFU86817.1 hypothetical protein CcrRogue_gp335 [Caulobacter phage CcrRogue]